jgi:YD repeat-containing protein
VLVYDSPGNLTALTDAAGKATSLAYADRQHPGDVTSITDPDRRVRTITYDGHGNRASVRISPSNGVTNTTETFYDLDGEPVCQAAPKAVAAGASCPNGGPPVPDTTAWSYDAVGNPNPRLLIRPVTSASTPTTPPATCFVRVSQ